MAALVVELVDGGLSRESTRKTLSTLAQVLDHAGAEPNPVRSAKVKLPRSEKRHVQPPTAEVLFEAVTALAAREDRTPERRVFQGFGADKFRTSLTRACTTAG